MTPAKQRWYPTLPIDAPGWMRDAFRKLCDRLYENRDDMGPASVTGKGSGSVIIGTTPTAINGAQLRIPRTGNWVIIGTWKIVVETGDQAKAIKGLLNIDGSAHQVQAQITSPAAGLTLTLCNVWRVTATAGQTLSLAVSKESTAAGASTVDGQHSQLTALWGGTS